MDPWPCAHRIPHAPIYTYSVASSSNVKHYTAKTGPFAHRCQIVHIPSQWTTQHAFLATRDCCWRNHLVSWKDPNVPKNIPQNANAVPSNAKKTNAKKKEKSTIRQMPPRPSSVL
jgi:hypothetical protein